MSQTAIPGYTPGRYDRFFTDDERLFLSRMSWNDLSPEIGLLRFCLERYTASLAGRPVTVANLRLVANSLEILGKLITVQNEVHSPVDEFNKAVDEAWRLSRIHWGLLPPDPVPQPLPSTCPPCPGELSNNCPRSAASGRVPGGGLRQGLTGEDLAPLPEPPGSVPEEPAPEKPAKSANSTRRRKPTIRPP